MTSEVPSASARAARYAEALDKICDVVGRPGHSNAFDPLRAIEAIVREAGYDPTLRMLATTIADELMVDAGAVEEVIRLYRERTGALPPAPEPEAPLDLPTEGLMIHSGTSVNLPTLTVKYTWGETEWRLKHKPVFEPAGTFLWDEEGRRLFDDFRLLEDRLRHMATPKKKETRNADPQ